MEHIDLQPIPKNWLERKLRPANLDYKAVIEELRPLMQEGDELWSFDEPAPPDVQAGVLGVALVRGGEPIHCVVLGIH